MNYQTAAGLANAGSDGQDLTLLFRDHHAELVHLGLLLVGSQATAEDIVQDVFARLCARDRLAPGVRALPDGHVLLSQSAQCPYIATAVSGPGGPTLTAVVLSGPAGSPRPSTVPGQLSVVQFSNGQRPRVLYQRATEPTDAWILGQNFPGQYWLLDGGDGPPPAQQHQGFNGWIRDGQLITLEPANGHADSETW